MNAERWVMTVPVLSTAHISPAVRDWFESGDSLAYDLCDDGYLIYCGELEDEAEDGTHFNDMEDFPELNKCMAWARRNGSNGWVRFTASGDLINELPRFNW